MRNLAKMLADACFTGALIAFLFLFVGVWRCQEDSEPLPAAARESR